MTPLEDRLREDLHELSDVPAPVSSVDQVLANARKARRRRIGLAAAGSTALALLIAVPLLPGMPMEGFHLPFGEPATGSPCESATDEADPPVGVPASGQPQFVRVFLTKLPPRDDYFLQSAYCMCSAPEEQAGLPSGYAVINLGPNREHGHVTITIQYTKTVPTCATLPAQPQEFMFCEDATATTPLVYAHASQDNYYSVTAVHSDGRSVTMEAIGTPFAPATVKSVVTEPELADQLT